MKARCNILRALTIACQAKVPCNTATPLHTLTRPKPRAATPHTHLPGQSPLQHPVRTYQAKVLRELRVVVDHVSKAAAGAKLDVEIREIGGYASTKSMGTIKKMLSFIEQSSDTKYRRIHEER